MQAGMFAGSFLTNRPFSVPQVDGTTTQRLLLSTSQSWKPDIEFAACSISCATIAFNFRMMMTIVRSLLDMSYFPPRKIRLEVSQRHAFGSLKRLSIQQQLVLLLLMELHRIAVGSVPATVTGSYSGIYHPSDLYEIPSRTPTI